MAQELVHIITSGGDLAPTMDAISRIRPYAALRLIWLIYIHCTINTRHTRLILPGYGKPWVLFPHIIAGFLEIFYFAILDLWADPAPPGTISLLLCVVQSVTNAILVWDLNLGIPEITRPTYLTSAILRPFLSISAHVLDSPDLHIISIYILDAFIYARLLIKYLRPALPAYRPRYAMAITGSALIAAGSGGWRVGASSGVGPLKGAVGIAGIYSGVILALMGIRGWWKARREAVPVAGGIRGLAM